MDPEAMRRFRARGGECVQCGEELKTGKRFCSPKCWHEWMRVNRREKGNPHWLGEEAQERCKRDRTRRRFVAERCEDCGATKAERHHLDGKTGNNDPANIAILCRRCHMVRDGRLERLPELGLKGRARVGRDGKGQFVRAA